MKLEPAFLSELDSGRIFRKIREKVEKKELLDEAELMEFIILPLSYRNRDEKEETIRTTVKLAAQIPDRSQQLFVLSGILTFTDKLIDIDTANQITASLHPVPEGFTDASLSGRKFFAVFGNGRRLAELE